MIQYHSFTFIESLYSILFLFGIVIIAFIIIRLIWYLFDTKEIYRQSFWWDTFDGMQCSTAILYKFKRLPFYFIIHDCNYRTPNEHPEYKQFLEKVNNFKKQ